MELRYNLGKKRMLVTYEEPSSQKHDLLGAIQNTHLH